MALLELEHVTKRYGRGAGERVALHDISLQVDAGELVAAWGRRRSGRSTLLRIAAGIEAPDEGVVRVRRHDLRDDSGTVRGEVRFCRKTFRPVQGELVLEQLITGQLTCGVGFRRAHTRAREALERTGAVRCAALRPSELDNTELVRVAIARALAHEPRLLVIDEPTIGVGLRDRDRILLLLRGLSDEGVAVLMSAGDMPGLSGADRAVMLSEGELHGEPPTMGLAPVVPLPGMAAQLHVP